MILETNGRTSGASTYPWVTYHTHYLPMFTPLESDVGPLEGLLDGSIQDN